MFSTRATENDLAKAFGTAAQRSVSGLVISTDPFFISHSTQLATMSLHHAVPAIFEYREFAAAGGLISYAASPTESYRLMGVYTGRVLKGEKSADLPVQQSTKLELIINIKTAKALGVNVPAAILAQADEVIE